MPGQAIAMNGSVPPTSVRFFYGRISRDEAEQVLKTRGCQEGLYLLRESMSTAGNYALSICHQNRMHHYSIERQADGDVMIQDGKKFKGPVELVQHHERILDGFLTRPTYPCDRPNDRLPMAWPGVTMNDLEKIILDKARNLKGPLESVLRSQRQQIVAAIARELHQDQPWYYGKITRDAADDTFKQEGHANGKYLVRERDDKSYALSLSYNMQTKHYKIDKLKSPGAGEKLAIEDGPRFDSLMDMVGHYHNKTDGLLCKLTIACVRPGYKKKIRAMAHVVESGIYAFGNPESGPEDYKDSPVSSIVGGGPAVSAGPIKPPMLSVTKRQPPTKPVRLHGPRGTTLDQMLNDPKVQAQGIAGNEHVRGAVWDDPDIPEVEGDLGITALSIDTHSQADPPPLIPRVPPLVTPLPNPNTQIEDDPQKIYDSVPRTDEVFNLNRHDLELHEKLGSGNFGSVMRGLYRRNSQPIPVAIKTLKQDDIPNAEGAIMKEARVMANLQHRNIVRLIGVCRSDTIMLVMELAPFGQLSKYLKKHAELQVKTVVELMFQVAEGMAYLESKHFVHRDLAARNVLLVNEHFAKISDFGMSKALGFGNNYYQAEKAGKWPLKWYAPECIYFFKFDSKSDVWSYGVTLWEALSYGAKPYKGLMGQQILEKIENQSRLLAPDRCPPGVYDIMMLCWRYEKSERPTFKDLVELLRKFK